MSLATDAADTSPQHPSALAIAPAQQPQANSFADVPLGQITPDPSQPRKVFDQAFLQELAESIRENGVIQPIVVRPSPAGRDGQLHICPYTIVAGETRWKASAIAGKATIPAIIRSDLTDADIVVMQVLENLQRRDLSLIETCEGVTRLVKEVGFEKAVAQLGKGKTWVSRHSTLTDLPPQVLDLVKSNKVESVDVAKDLAQLVELDGKAGAIAVGRFAGTHTSYGSPIAQATLDAEDLAELSEEERQQERERVERLSRPPTRAEIREQLGVAKRAVEQKQKVQAERQEAKNDPAMAKAREEEKRRADKTKADNQRREQLKGEQKTFEAEQTTALCQALGRKAPVRSPHGFNYDEPLTVQAVDGLYPGSAVPASLNAMKFKLRFKGCNAQMLQRLKSAGFTTKVEVSLAHTVSMTPEVAAALETLLGAKQVQFATEIDCKGAEVPGFIARFKAAPAATPKATAKPGGKATQTMSSIEQFLHSKALVDKPGARIKAADLHGAYVKWCKGQKLEPLPLNGANNAFGAAIEEMGIKKIRSNGFHYLDIALA